MSPCRAPCRLALLALVTLLLAACGNKGPLVKPGTQTPTPPTAPLPPDAAPPTTPAAPIPAPDADGR